MKSLNSFIQPLDSADQIAQNRCLRFRNKGVDIGIVSSYFKRNIFRFEIIFFYTDAYQYLNFMWKEETLQKHRLQVCFNCLHLKNHALGGFFS